MNKEKLIAKASEFRERQDAVESAIAIGDLDKIKRHAGELVSLKKQIKRGLFDTPVATVPENEYESERRLLHKIAIGEQLPVEEKITSTILLDILDRRLDDEEKSQTGKWDPEDLLEKFEPEDFEMIPVFDADLSNDELRELTDEYYAGHGYNYSATRYDAGSLIIARAGTLPENLSIFLVEARECLALGRYLAVYSLCRTVLDISVRDVYLEEGLGDKQSQGYRYVEEHMPNGQRKHVSGIFAETMHEEDINPTLFQMMIMLGVLPQYQPLKSDLHGIRTKANSLVHGRKGVDAREAGQMLEDTLQVIHNMYEVQQDYEA